VKISKRWLAVPAVLAGVVLLTAGSCQSQNAGDKAESEYTERVQRQYNQAQPPHAYDASQARANLIAAHAAMAYGADSWTVQQVEGVGITFQCPSVGFPIPFGTNLTNPDKLAGNREGGYVTVPQMEPWGAYVPPDVAATYANCVLPNGEIGVFYSEPMLTTFLFDVDCDPESRACTIPAGSEATVQVERVDPEAVNQQDAEIEGE
jgi:hypothetical protein